MRLVAAVLALIASVIPALSDSKTVRDWTAACDDYACTAEATGAGGLAMGGQGYRLQIARSNDPSGAWFVTLIAKRVPQPDSKSPATFKIAGFDLPPTAFSPAGDGERFDVSGQASLEKIFPALRKGSAVEIAFTSSDGPASETFSLSGIAAVLLWIDEQQRRVGNSDQVAAVGDPKVTGEVTGAEWDAIHERIGRINVGGSCQWNDKDQEPPPLPIETHDLGEGYTLYIVGCMLGAYQPSTLIFIEGEDGLVPMPFADYSSDGGWGATLELGFVDFDAKTKELSNFVKFRGLGDCGASSRLRWTGYSFKLLEYRYRDCSDEPAADPDGEIPEFPVVYEAK